MLLGTNWRKALGAISIHIVVRRSDSIGLGGKRFSFSVFVLWFGMNGNVAAFPGDYDERYKKTGYIPRIWIWFGSWSGDGNRLLRRGAGIYAGVSFALASNYLVVKELHLVYVAAYETASEGSVCIDALVVWDDRRNRRRWSVQAGGRGTLDGDSWFKVLELRG